MRANWVVVIALIGLGVTGTAFAAGPTTPLPLSPERYASIATVLKAELTLDARKPVAGRVAQARLACRGLARTDVLVSAFRASCLADTDATRQLLALGGCKPVRPCVTAVRRYSAATAAEAAAGRAMNRLLATEVPDAPCRKAMRYSAAELRVYDRLHQRADAVDQGLRSESQPQFLRALGRFVATDRRAVEAHRDRLHTFRVACR